METEGIALGPLTAVSRGRHAGRVFRVFLAAYLCLTATVLVLFAFQDERLQSPWGIGDWLINYEGGFVRRGLPGELLLLLGKAVHVPFPELVVGVQLALWAVLLISIWKLVLRSSRAFWVVALVVSPATTGFPLLDMQSGFRKEEIFLAGLGALVLLLARRHVQPALLVPLLSVFAAGTVLSHEALICFLPYVAAAVVMEFPDLREAAMVLAFPALIAVLCFYVSVRHPGNRLVASAVCNSLGPGHGSLCDGAIYALQFGPPYAHQAVLQMMERSHPLGRYLLLALLSLAPAGVGFRTLWKHARCRRDLSILLLAFVISSAESAMLFIYALDWGRWIYVHVFSVFLLLLLVERKSRRGQDNTADSRLKFPAGPRGVLAVLLLVLYAGTWNMPRIPTVRLRGGYLGICARLMRQPSGGAGVKQSPQPAVGEGRSGKC